MNAHKAYQCEDCATVSEEPGGRLYECGGCGTIFTRENSYTGTNHQCPDCLKFGSKIADLSCASCEQGKANEGYVCEGCEDFYETEAEAEDCCHDFEAPHQSIPTKVEHRSRALSFQERVMEYNTRRAM